MMLRGALAVMGRRGLVSCTDGLPGAPDATAEFAPATFPLPEIVERNLPAEVPLAELRVREGCFYDRSDGEVNAVTTNGGGTMLSYCIG